MSADELPYSQHFNRLAFSSRKIAAAQIEFLELRRRGLQESAALIARQIAMLQRSPQVVFDLEDLTEFAQGDIVKCLGPAYSVYGGRRSPRIPNGDLLLMSRILEIRAVRPQLEQKSSVLAEYDVPAQAWFLPDGAGLENQLPLSIALEIGLQPCGFLSAYLETPLAFPAEDYYFRNLGGKALYTRRAALRGKTVQVRASLEKTVISAATIIQDFLFELSCENQVFFKGQSSFGYFPRRVMENQPGLDRTGSIPPWVKSQDRLGKLPSVPANRAGFSDPKFPLVDPLHIDLQGGLEAGGYVFGSMPVSPDDWYFACHFYQDPVMPGSLGIEAIVQAVKNLIQVKNGQKMILEIAPGDELSWKYRGQVLPDNRAIELEAHLRLPPGNRAGDQCWRSNASLWADGKRIYEVQNLALTAAGI